MRFTVGEVRQQSPMDGPLPVRKDAVDEDLGMLTPEMSTKQSEKAWGREILEQTMMTAKKIFVLREGEIIVTQTNLDPSHFISLSDEEDDDILAAQASSKEDAGVVAEEEALPAEAEKQPEETSAVKKDETCTIVRCHNRPTIPGELNQMSAEDVQAAEPEETEMHVLSRETDRLFEETIQSGFYVRLKTGSCEYCGAPAPTVDGQLKCLRITQTLKSTSGGRGALRNIHVGPFVKNVKDPHYTCGFGQTTCCKQWVLSQGVTSYIFSRVISYNFYS